MRNIILAVVAICSLAVAGIGDMFASFGDIETSQGNYIDMADLDLKVNGEDDHDVDILFNITNGMICTIYPSSPSPIPLWNEGCVDGTLYLHIKNLVGPNSLSQNVNMEIWYDDDWVTKGSLYDLACQQIELGHMPGNGMIMEVSMELHATGGASGECLTFDVAFELFDSCGFSDIETSQGNYFGLGAELGGTPGFWSSPAAVRQYGKFNLALWFRSIVLSSAWFEDELAEGTDDEVYTRMKDILKETGAAGYQGAVNQFRSQYLATRLNTMPDPPRLGLHVEHNITSIPNENGYVDASDYFGYEIGTLQEIINTIESKASGDIFTPQPKRPDILIMMAVCDALNNP